METYKMVLKYHFADMTTLRGPGIYFINCKFTYKKDGKNLNEYFNLCCNVGLYQANTFYLHIMGSCDKDGKRDSRQGDLKKIKVSQKTKCDATIISMDKRIEFQVDDKTGRLQISEYYKGMDLPIELQIIRVGSEF